MNEGNEICFECEEEKTKFSISFSNNSNNSNN